MFSITGGKQPKPTSPKFPTARFAESGSEAADAIAKSRKKKGKGRRGSKRTED